MGDVPQSWEVGLENYKNKEGRVKTGDSVVYNRLCVKDGGRVQIIFKKM